MKPRIYLDNCCFNRPFDNQSNVVVHLETEAKLHVQERIRNGEIELAWSFILDLESSVNPYQKRRDFTEQWKPLAAVDIQEDEDIFLHAHAIMKHGLRHKDSLHVACAVRAQCQYLLTTDKRMLKKSIDGITLINPLDYVRKMEAEE